MGEQCGISLELFHALMKEHGEQGAEQATWKGSSGTTETEDHEHINRN